MSENVCPLRLFAALVLNSGGDHCKGLQEYEELADLIHKARRSIERFPGLNQEQYDLWLRNNLPRWELQFYEVKEAE